MYLLRASIPPTTLSRRCPRRISACAEVLLGFDLYISTSLALSTMIRSARGRLACFQCRHEPRHRALIPCA